MGRLDYTRLSGHSCTIRFSKCSYTVWPLLKFEMCNPSTSRKCCFLKCWKASWLKCWNFKYLHPGVDFEMWNMLWAKASGKASCFEIRIETWKLPQGVTRAEICPWVWKHFLKSISDSSKFREVGCRLFVYQWGRSRGGGGPRRRVKSEIWNLKSEALEWWRPRRRVKSEIWNLKLSTRDK